MRPVTEYRFCKQRKWRLDIAYVDQRIGVEINGQAHGRATQRRRDYEKYNHLVEDGWKLLIYPADAVLAKCRQPLIVEQIARVVAGVHDPDLSTCVLR